MLIVDLAWTGGGGWFFITSYIAMKCMHLDKHSEAFTIA